MSRLPILLLALALVAGIAGVGYLAFTDGSASTREAPLRALASRIDACTPADAAHGPDSGGLRCIELVYVWSPSMPLSVEGMGEARRAAGDMGLGLTVLPASELEEDGGAEDEGAEESAEAEARAELDDSAADLDDLRSALIDAGASVHFPALVVLQAGTPVGSALVGYKGEDAYEELLSERLSAARQAPALPEPAPLGVPDQALEPRADAPDIDVIWTRQVSPPPGAFFRGVPGTSFITYDQRGTVFLRDLDSSESFRGPGWIDFVPSPDGAFFVTPGPDDSGLEFYLAREVFEAGEDGDARDVEPVFTDPRMADQYPSVGILETDGQGRAVRYRVLVSWFSGLAFRDYEVSWSGGEATGVTPVTPKLDGCPDMDLSLPILSRSGLELAARDEDTGTTGVYAMADDGTCREVFDLGRQTSKVGFNDDGSLIAYSTPGSSTGGSGGQSRTYVLDRAAMRTIPIPNSTSRGLVIPEIVGADSVLIAVREGDRSESAEFRLLCCVR